MCLAESALSALRVEQLKVPHRRRRIDSRLWREWCFARMLFKRFRNLLLIMAGLLGGGALLFMVLEQEKHHSFARGIYFTWSLVFGEPPEAFPAHPVLQTLFFLLPVIGLLVILDGILEFSFMMRDRARSERSWCLTMTHSFSDHIILVGMGRLGFQTFQLLRRLGEAVVVVERSAENQFLEEVRRDGSPLFVCDARREAILEDVNIASARSIILCTTDDLANLEVALDARKINPKIRVVLRMFDQHMADKIRDGFHIRIAMSQAALSAPTFAMAAIDRSILNSQVVGDELVVMQRWHVRKNGPLFERTVADVLSEFSFGIVERRSREGVRLYPTPDTRLEDGDELIVQGAYDALVALQQREKRSAAAAIEGAHPG